MEFFTAGVGVLKTLVTAIGAGLGAWGVINLEDTEEIIKRASEKKIKIYPIKDYYYKKNSDRRIILGYAKMNIDKIKLGMKELLKK